jgi:hypothetical protein
LFNETPATATHQQSDQFIYRFRREVLAGLAVGD